MTNYEKLQSLPLQDCANWLSKIAEERPWQEWFDNSYCKKCQPIWGKYKGREKEVPFAWCELHDNKCMFFSEKDGLPGIEDEIEGWLKEEAERY